MAKKEAYSLDQMDSIMPGKAAARASQALPLKPSDPAPIEKANPQTNQPPQPQYSSAPSAPSVEPEAGKWQQLKSHATASAAFTGITVGTLLFISLGWILFCSRGATIARLEAELDRTEQNAADEGARAAQLRSILNDQIASCKDDRATDFRCMELYKQEYLLKQ